MTEFGSHDFKKIRITEDELGQFLENAKRDLSIAHEAKRAQVKFEFTYKALIKLGIALVAKTSWRSATL